ncbi:MAG: hypothetical protein A2W53_00105 [Nitrospinae bacterium RIFCSPHIGHO2_02_39_11]|nr:MAG: hypothetical protein A2W53_00105 [Nitrospinae bacterium RIFCSPHIGHO2_02_39_11]
MPPIFFTYLPGLNKENGEILDKVGMARRNSQLKKGNSPVVPNVDTTVKHSTRTEIAEELGWSHGKVSQADVVFKKAPDEIKEKLRILQEIRIFFLLSFSITFMLYLFCGMDC